MTDYVILFQQDNGGWMELEKRIPARSGTSAIRALLDGAEARGQYVAIPARSFRPVTVKLETKTQLRFS